ncbi:hypothetical protein CEXT_543131 [Caerostris extrusa]|uniref:Uncharacterized protein n=1 Tax=Caerostris extrusa TaxID=172846 RepID=A0AAV4TPA2_CAEEX|nr:hypothetical protein CEXT_543131 [Caerostris extrusa]
MLPFWELSGMSSGSENSCQPASGNLWDESPGEWLKVKGGYRGFYKHLHGCFCDFLRRMRYEDKRLIMRSGVSTIAWEKFSLFPNTQKKTFPIRSERSKLRLKLYGFVQTQWEDGEIIPLINQNIHLITIDNGLSVEDAGVKEPPAEEPGGEDSPVFEAGIKYPPVLKAGVEEPSVLETGVEKPTVLEAGVNEPTVLDAAVEEPLVLETGVENQSVVDLNVEEPLVLDAGVDKPPVLEAGVEDPPVVEAGVEEPQVFEAGVDETAVLDAGIESPYTQ